MSMPLTGAVAGSVPEGITNPPIDDLLGQVSSKYALVIYAAKRARQINDYYSQLGEGLLEYVGPLVEPGPREKPLSIAMREIQAGLLEHTEGEQYEPDGRAPGAARAWPAASPPTRRASCCAGSPRPGTPCGCCPPRPRWSSSAPPPSRRCPGSPVHTGVFADVPTVPHVRLGQEADLVVVAPATADLLARAAHGRADDLLTATLLTARCPVLLAPAMHTEMWEHPATRDNVALLRSRGVVVHGARVRPADRRGHRPGPAARPGRDRRAGPAAAGARRRAAARPRRAGGSWCPRAAPGSRWTRCASSATARRAGRATRSPRVAAQRGAQVTLVAAHTADLGDPAAVDVVRVGSALRAARRHARRGRRAPTPW